MLMCDLNSVKLLRFDAQILHSDIDALAADSCVHQKVGVIGSNVGAVSAASAGYRDKSHIQSLFLMPFFLI